MNLNQSHLMSLLIYRYSQLFRSLTTHLRIVVWALVFVLVFSPITVVAQETPALETPETASTTAETLPDNHIPVFLFADESGGVLGVVPFAEDLFLWAYATTTDGALVGFTNPQGPEFADAASTESENPPITLLGVLLVPLDLSGAQAEQFSDSGAGVVQRKFTGHEFDRDTALTYANARYYKQNIGRFLSQDPVFLAVGAPDLKQVTGLELQHYLENPQALNAYSYTANNPLKYVDEGGTFFGEPGRAFASGQRQIANFLNQAADYTSSQGGLMNRISGFVTHAVADTVSNVANVFDPDQNAGTRLLGLGLTALDVAGGGRSGTVQEGYRSYSAFKYAMGRAGEGRQWHHIVKQTVNKLNFAPEMLHNLENIVSIPVEMHRTIGGYYSSIRSFTDGQTVRQWLSTQSFEKQFDFGKQILDKAMKGEKL